MGYKARSSVIISSMFGIVFIFLYLVAEFYLGWSVYLIAGLSLGIVLLQYLISPLIIGWIYRIQWIDNPTIGRQYPHFAEFLQRTTQKYGIKPPKFGIIPDGTPNAFCFGWSKNSAKLVITRGILELLDPDEQLSVVAHEMGHIVHNDFIVMTFISAIPTMFYTLFRVLINSGRYRTRGSQNNEKIQAAKYLLAVLSYIMYIIGYLLSMVLSRIREYWADEFSAKETGKPNALATSLVKIAYGIMIDPSQAKNQGDRSQYIRALGIFDRKSAKELVYSASSNKKKGTDYDLLARAAAWDLYMPWAKYFEILSTHPLPAKRIKALGYIAYKEYGQDPIINFDKARDAFESEMGKSAMDEFLGELFIQIMPKFTFFGWIILTLFMVFGGTDFSGLGILGNFLAFGALAFVFAGIFQLIQNAFKYKETFTDHNIADLIGTIKVSPVRPIPTVTKGAVIGKGVPGLFWSEDVVMRDATGIMFIDYDFGIGFINTLFGIFKAKELSGKNIEVWGWYRRGPSPYIQVHKIKLLDGSGKSFGNYKKMFWNIAGIILIILGLVLMTVFGLYI
jgi:heat shock protein HtpX